MSTSSPTRAGGFSVAVSPGIAVVCVLLLASAGCKEIDAPSASSPAAPPVTAENETTSNDPESNQKTSKKKVTMDKKDNTPESDQPGLISHSIPPELMQQLIDTVAREAGVSEEDVVLERAEDTTWSDGSLGCPQPNMAYSQAQVDGHWVLFRVGREEFDMRVTKRGMFMRCTGSTKQPPIRFEDS